MKELAPIAKYLRFCLFAVFCLFYGDAFNIYFDHYLQMTNENYECSYYNFDSATVGFGYVDISEHKTVLFFPALEEAFTSVPKECNLYLNNNLVLSTKWLPYFSEYDFYRIHDMFQKCLYSFERHYIPYVPSPYRLYNKLVTQLFVNNFIIYTLEEQGNTSIQITNEKSSLLLTFPPIEVFKIYIGSSLVFCSERDLSGLNREDTLYIIGYILSKFTD
jgi:hypothetical protein